MLDPIATFKKIPSFIAGQIYEEVDRQIPQIERVLRNIGIACRYRAEIFGSDADWTGSYITGLLSAADILAMSVSQNLPYAFYFNMAPNKEDKALAYSERAEKVTQALHERVKDLIEIVDTDEIPERLVEGVICDQPVIEIVKNHKLLVDEAMKGVAIAEDRLLVADMSVILKDGVLQLRPDLTAAFKGVSQKLILYRDDCDEDMKRQYDLVTLVSHNTPAAGPV